MFEIIFSWRRLPSILLLTVLFQSCHHNSAIELAKELDNFEQPKVNSLKFTGQRQLKWDEIKTSFKPSLSKRLDIDKLPVYPYDTIGFKNFTQLPVDKSFDIDVLPQKTFSLGKLPTIPIGFTTKILAPPAVSKPTLVPISTNEKLSVFENLTLQGLAGKYISCTFKDAAGFIWITTEKGLSRYDGEFLLTYKAITNQEIIYGICQDNRGRIWLISQQALTVVDTQNGILSRSDKIKTNNSESSAMLEDDKGRIWICNSIPLGVNVIDPVSETFKNLTVASGFFDSVDWDASGLLEVTNHNIWISHLKGSLQIYNIQKGVVKFAGKGNGLDDDPVSVQTMDEKGRIWISMPGGNVNRIDVQHSSVTTFSQSQGLGVKGISKMVVTNNGRIWIIGGGSLTMLDPDKNKYKRFENSFDLDSHLLVDARGRIWQSGYYQGLKIIDQNIIHKPNDQYAQAVARDTFDRVWSTALANGIELIDPEKNTKQFLTKDQGLGSNYVTDLIEHKGNILVVSEKGLDIIYPKQKTIEQYVIKDFITELYPDSKGHFWYSGAQNGLFFADTSKQTIKHTNMAGGLSGNVIESIAEDSEGQIWIATNFDGIDIINPEMGTVKYLNLGSGLAQCCSKTLLPDQSGRMWIGTDDGLFVADNKHKTLMKFSTKEGLADNPILSLNSYNGSILVGTANKVTKITPPDGGNTHTSVNWEINTLKYSENFFGTFLSETVDKVNKEGMFERWGRNVSVIPEIKPENYDAAVYISALQIMTFPQYFTNNDHELPSIENSNQVQGLSWDSVSGPYNMPVNLKIPYDQNLLQFQYAQANFGSLDTTWYRYVLEGKDTSWSDVTNITISKSYVNLSPGHYVFKVSGKLANGHWSKPAVFTFTIRPPWWQTAGFRLFILTFMLAFLWLLVKYFYNRKLGQKNAKLERELLVQKERMRISTEMHDDIGAGLFGINLQTELLKNKISEPEIVDSLVKIHHAIGQISAKVREVIWSLNTDNDNLNNVISFIHQQAHRKFENSATQLSVISPPDMPQLDIAGDKRRQIYLIINEALNNILKHAEASMAEIDFELHERQLAIIIRDNGRGFIDDVKSTDKIGLRSIRERVQKLYGKLKLSSGPEGTVLAITIPVS